jgi:hypothetical protein
LAVEYAALSAPRTILPRHTFAPHHRFTALGRGKVQPEVEVE